MKVYKKIKKNKKDTMSKTNVISIAFQALKDSGDIENSNPLLGKLLYVDLEKEKKRKEILEMLKKDRDLKDMFMDFVMQQNIEIQALKESLEKELCSSISH